LIALAAAALCAAPGLAACGSDDEAPEALTVTVPATEEATASADGSGSTEQVEADTPASEVDAAPSADPPAPKPTLALEVPQGAHPVVWVRAGERPAMRTQPGGGELVERIGRRTKFGSPTVFGVVEQRGDWAGVSTELLPNGELGWIRLDPKTVEGGWTKFSIEVDLSDRTAALIRGKRPARSFPVTVGAAPSSTPTGRFAVTDTFTDLNSSAYGCCALALSATQPNLPSGWLGGNRIAIHGTSGPLGVAASSGCVRAADPEVEKLVRAVPLGTPVFIRG
jgi:L,D-transpeptidase catalytic domain